MIMIELNTLEEALHLQNVAVLTASKYQENPVEGQECQQNSNIRIWQEIARQASKAVDKFVTPEEKA